MIDAHRYTIDAERGKEKAAHATDQQGPVGIAGISGQYIRGS